MAPLIDLVACVMSCQAFSGMVGQVGEDMQCMSSALVGMGMICAKVSDVPSYPALLSVEKLAMSHCLAGTKVFPRRVRLSFSELTWPAFLTDS